MFDGFTARTIETAETTIFLRSGGSGPPLLMWRDVAPFLARDFTVVCADLRGYGQSGCPVSTSDHAPYAKRAMAADMVSVMRQLGFDQFAVAGHDRGRRYDVEHRTGCQILGRGGRAQGDRRRGRLCFPPPCATPMSMPCTTRPMSMSVSMRSARNIGPPPPWIAPTTARVAASLARCWSYGARRAR